MSNKTSLVLLVLLGGCVSGTPYQRAIRLQRGEASPDEIVQGLSDQSWKIRCLAARACGASGASECMSVLRQRVSSDGDERVQACFLEALALRCDLDGRDLLAGISWAQDARPGELVEAAFADAVASCPSADAALTLATTPGEPFRKALAMIAPAAVTAPRSSRGEFEKLGALVTLAAPRDRAAAALSEARKHVQELEAARQRAAEKEAALAEAAELALETNRAATLEAASSAIRVRDFDRAEQLILNVERLDGDGPALRAELAAARFRVANEHLAKARQLLREGKAVAAESELESADALGVSDAKLRSAIAASPEIRRRAAEEQRRASEKVIDELVEEHLSNPTEGAFEVSGENEAFFGAVSSSDVVAFGSITSSVWRGRLAAAKGPYQRQLVEKALRSDLELALQLKAVRRRLEGATFSFTEDSLEPVWLSDRFFLRLFDEDPALPVERTKYYYHPNSVLLNEHSHFRCRRLRGLPEQPWAPGACGLDLEGLPRKLMATIENRNHSWRWLWTGLGAERRLWMRSNPLEPTRCYSVKGLRVELRDEQRALLWTLK